MNCPACDHVNADGARYCAKCGALLPVAHLDGSDPMIGTVVGGRYRITSLLGEGGMGRVYIGEQQMGTAVRKVAVKTLLQEFSKDPQVVARFMRECGTVVELEHPNTIKFYDFGQTDLGDLYIAMEFVNGRPLAEVIETDGAMSFDRVDKIMKQICGSLAEAHDKGIVHRDLKPENIILTKRAGEDDFAKVLDFGIAKRNEESDNAKEQKLTQAGMVLGTPPYMSPEQFTGKGLDRRSDIYSLGVMAYEMLTGQLPFKANTPWEWATQHMTAQPSPFEETGAMAAQIPPHIKAACMRALSKSSDDRQPTAMDFYRDLHGDGSAPAVAPTQPGVSATAAFTAPAGAAPAVTAGLVTPEQPAMAAPAGSRQSTGTQVGEPLVAPPGAAPLPGMPHQSVPTGGGQAIPAPPMAHSGGGGGGGGGGKGVMIAVALLVAGGLGVGAFFMLGETTESDPPLVNEDDSGETSGETSEEPKPASDGGEGGSSEGGSSAEGGKGGAGGSSATPASSGSAEPDGTASAPDPTDPAPNPTPKPPSNAAACSQAQSAASQKRCGAAAGYLSKCTGPGRTMAQAQYNSNCSSPSKKRRRRRALKRR